MRCILKAFIWASPTSCKIKTNLFTNNSVIGACLVYDSWSALKLGQIEGGINTAAFTLYPIQLQIWVRKQLEPARWQPWSFSCAHNPYDFLTSCINQLHLQCLLLIHHGRVKNAQHRSVMCSCWYTVVLNRHQIFSTVISEYVCIG